MLDIIGDFELTKKSQSVFNALIEGRRPIEGEKAGSAEEMIHREGPSYGLESYPDPFVSFVETVHKKLSSIGQTLISILRWRYAQEGPPSPFGSRGLFCSGNNGESWHPLPGRYSIQNVTPPYSVFELNEIDADEIIALLKSNAQEPLGHELLREAKELQYTSPRSAVLIAVSAIEVAVKSVIMTKVPDAAWFIENIQSPPVVNILTKYLPILFSNVSRFYEPRKESGTIKVLNEAVTIRNQIVHKGVSPPKDEKISEILDAIQELLWVCDYFSGNLWAEEYISRKV